MAKLPETVAITMHNGDEMMAPCVIDVHYTIDQAMAAMQLRMPNAVFSASLHDGKWNSHVDVWMCSLERKMDYKPLYRIYTTTIHN
jgi:hypothetical protein